jgi:hypothetical protein
MEGKLWSTLQTEGASILEICRKRRKNIRKLYRKENYKMCRKYISCNDGDEYLSGKVKNCSL